MKKVTLGMCVYDDFDGVYFSCQSNRLLHPVLDAEGEVIVIDNNPGSKVGRETRKFCEASRFIRYIPVAERRGTSVRNEIFNRAESDLVITIDSHVILRAGAVDAVINFFGSNKDDHPILLQGPYLADDLTSESREWQNLWRRGLFGWWDEKLPLSEGDAFAIENMGLGAFAARRSTWPGFHPLFTGFGGEEGYIHEKYRRAGGETLSLPAFKWVHRFPRVQGNNYPMYFGDRIYNYFIGCFDLGLNPDRAIEYYSALVSSVQVKGIFNRARRDFIRYSEKNTQPESRDLRID